MMKCTNCGSMIGEDSVFCPECGTPVTKQEEVQQAATLFCPMCGAVLEEGSEWCSSCGVALAAAKNHTNRQGLNFNKKLIIPIAVAVAVVCVVILFINIFGGKQHPIFYVKDGNLYASEWKEDSEIRVEKDINEYGYSSMVEISDDEKYLYYAVGEERGYDLYRKKMRDLDGDDERIAKDVVTHILLDDNRVVYRNTDDDLNVAVGDESERVAKDVESYRVNEKQTEIIWINEDGDLYKRDVKLKKDDERLAKEVDYFIAATDDFEEIAYVAEDAVYVLCDYENEEKVFEVDEVASDYRILEDEASNHLVFYFSEQSGEEEMTAYDYVRDDLLDQDLEISEPERSDYEHVEMKKDYWGNSYEDVVLSDEYYDDYEKYEEKLYRDRDREYLKETVITRKKYDLCYYTVKDGKEKLSSSYECSLDSVIYDEALVVVSQIQEYDHETAKMSDFYNGELNMYDFCSSLSYGAAGEKTISLYEGKSAAPLDTDKDETVYLIGTNEKDKVVYAQLHSSEDSDFDLVSIKYGSKLGEMKTIEQDVESAVCLNEQIFYVSDDNLYCNEERIDKDVECISGSVIEDSKWVVLFESDEDDNEGELKLWNGRKLSDVEKDVYSYIALEKNKIILLHDYSNYSGTLSFYNGRKVQRIDRDVTRLIDCY